MLHSHKLEELDSEYHADKAYIGSTSLRLFAKDKREYYVAAISGNLDNPESESLTLGKLVHAMVLEPDTVASRYCAAPAVDRRTKKGKEAHEEALGYARIAGLQMVKADVWETAKTMTESLLASEAGRVILRLKERVAESSIRWADDATGVQCKCRPDLLGIGKSGPVCIDLKTTRDVFDFSTSARKYGYHRQQAFYSMGLRELYGEPVRFLFAAIDKRAPYISALFEYDIEPIIAAESRVGQDLVELARYQSGELEWPDITTGIQPLTVPDWEIDRLLGVE